MLYTDCDQAIFIFIKSPRGKAEKSFLAAFASKPDDTLETLGFEMDVLGEWTIFQDDMADDPWHYNDGYQTETITNDCDVIYCYYNADNCGGALKVMQNGKVIRDFWNYPDDNDLSKDNKNIGLLDYEANHPITSWVDIVDYINFLLHGVR